MPRPLSISWSRNHTTNADGNAGTRISPSYRLYLGTSAPACPGTPFPHGGVVDDHPVVWDKTASTVVTGLTAGDDLLQPDHRGRFLRQRERMFGRRQRGGPRRLRRHTDHGDQLRQRHDRPLRSIAPLPCRHERRVASPARPPSPRRSASCRVETFTLAAGASQTVTVRFQPTTTRDVRVERDLHRR